jgi:hypothetical protein
MSKNYTLVCGNHNLRVKSHYAGGNCTLRVEIHLVRVVIAEFFLAFLLCAETEKINKRLDWRNRSSSNRYRGPPLLIIFWSCSISSCCNTLPMECPRFCWCRSICVHNGKYHGCIWRMNWRRVSGVHAILSITFFTCVENVIEKPQQTT